MTKEDLNFIKDAFSQIIDDIAGNPDWHDAASAVASNLGTLERQLKEKVVELPSDLDEAADTFAHNGDVNGVGGDDYEDDLRITFKAGAEWMAEQGCTVEIDEGYFINNPQHDKRKGKFHKYYSSTFGHGKEIVVTPGDKVIIQIRKK